MNDSQPAGGAILAEYLPKLMRLAEANMSSRLKAKIDAEEMAGSIVGSIWRLNQLGKLPISIQQSSDFWRLIVVIALNKIRRKARYHGAEKRDYARELPLLDQLPEFAQLVRELGEPTADDGAQMAQALERLQEELTDDERIVLEGKFQGKDRFEIAKQLDQGRGRTTKTVTRIWKRIEQKGGRIAEDLQS